MSKRVVIPKNLDKYQDFPDGQETLSKEEFELLVLKYWKEKKLEKKKNERRAYVEAKIQERSNIRELQWSNLTPWI